MGNTCGTCAFDNRGTEVDMKETKKGGGMAKMSNQPRTGAVDYNAKSDDYNKHSVNLNDTAEFLEPPDYQCEAVMVSQLTKGIQKEQSKV